MNDLEKKKKEDKKKDEKFWFDIKVESNIPAILHYKVFAKDAEEAAEMVRMSQPRRIEYQVPRKRDIKLTVYEAGMLIIKFVKQLGR